MSCVNYMKEWVSFSFFIYITYTSMASKKERKLKITFVPSDLDEKVAEENMLRIYEHLFFFNSDREPFYEDLSNDDELST